ncbi:glycogen debranching protein GlgX [Rhizobium halophytocola]|uniref:glycogen debranching protein GlgX n=1 Tax=Rhizobium halophytocola TaxID=735519 RepID=UPI00361B30E9
MAGGKTRNKRADAPQSPPPGVIFRVWSGHAERIHLCLYDPTGAVETDRLEMRNEGDGHFELSVPGIALGTLYGYRAHGPFVPDQSLWFDPAKLLLDPYATEIDRPFVYDPRLGQFGEDTAALMPKAVVRRHEQVEPAPPRFAPGGFVYEIAVKGFTMRHPDVPEAERGTIAALAHPSVIAHLKRIGVDAVELMPITAWIDERHLPPLGLSNAWGYNPVGLMTIDPRLAPGGVAELRDTVAALHAAGIGVILDLVFNHTGESDRHGATLSLRGLDNLSCYAHEPGRPGDLVNVTGCGNTLACDHPFVRQLILDSLRHFALNAGVDGFRFDLGPVLGRGPEGFDPNAETLRQMMADPVLADRMLIAEPWDIGHGGYQLGNFPDAFLEWNDQSRDRIRRFWRGDGHMTGDMATALAGASDVFARDGAPRTRSVNFIAAHDGFSLMDLVSYEHKHNEANGEDNRDGHNDNLSWNNGAEGETADDGILTRRRQDVMALLSTLFVSRGTIMLTAGDELGRTQHGNNNAYCQDNESIWIDWSTADEALIDHTARLARLRKRFSALGQTTFFTGDGNDVAWFSAGGAAMTVGEWEAAETPALLMVLATHDTLHSFDTRITIAINRQRRPQSVTLPPADKGWRALSSDETTSTAELAPRSIAIFVEC